MSYWTEDPQGVLFFLHVLPNAPRTEIVGRHGDALKIKIHAPPVDGKANAEIIRFFAQELKIPKSRVEMVSGETSKSKRVRIHGMKWSEVSAKLALPA